jgi:hypothetical protein
MIYCATYRLFGESYTYRADSPEALQSLIFGQAYAPSAGNVIYWQENPKGGA